MITGVSVLSDAFMKYGRNVNKAAHANIWLFAAFMADYYPCNGVGF